MFAVRWENHGKNRSGYSPRCANEWRPGRCAKPKGRCGECQNQAFVKVGDSELLAHLRGRQTIGIYPLLADDTCRLLAIDLDGHAWAADVRAIRQACRSLGLEPAVERSRSGNGAHVWFFFSGNVAAATARRLGFAILTTAMAGGAQLGVSSYDRLFPSQDVLPRGGFGNLIALPLQYEARKEGNSEFLDDDLRPHDDQWTHLATVERIAPARVADLVNAVGSDAELAVQKDSDERDAPWRPPPGLREQLKPTGTPSVIRATLADRLYVERDALPPPLLHAIKRTATFSNPTFVELQRMRLSVARTPRVIACFQDFERHLAVPRGCLSHVEQLLRDLDVELQLNDERVAGSPLAVDFTGQLTESQQVASKSLLEHSTGVLCAPPGWGKTVLAANLIAARARSTVILVHRKPLVEQWITRLAEFLNLNSIEIGTIGGGRKKLTGQIDVAMIQTLARTELAPEALRQYGHIVVDECHHVPAVSTERILGSLHARYITALTATPHRRDGHQPIVTMQCGPIRHTVTPRSAAANTSIPFRVTRRETSFLGAALPAEASIQEIFGALAADEARLQLIVGDIRELLAEGRATIVLTERRDHLKRLADLLLDDIPGLVLLHGGVTPKTRRAELHRLANLEGDDEHLVLATGRYIGEGFDAPRLDTLLLTMPISWRGTIIQYAGRLHRQHPAKRDVRIYDYVDDDVPVLRRMYAKRLATYKRMGYTTDVTNRIGLSLTLASVS